MACRKVIFMMCILVIFSKIEICYPDTAIENVFVASARRIGPAVVCIVTKHAFEVKIIDDVPIIGKIFRTQETETPSVNPRKFEQVGIGSGIIIDSDGYILTADFVVTNTEDIKVILSDRREFKGEVKGRDKRRGVAVIKIEAKGLPAVELGDSDALKLIQFVMATGYDGGLTPYGDGPSFTIGVISALHRSLPFYDKYVFSDLIQTDAFMRLGFGGGPLVDTNGKVIGICFVTESPEKSPGIGYAIPINRVKDVLEKLKLGKEIDYGWMGIGLIDIDDRLAADYGLKDKRGVFIAEVFKDTPAEKSGLWEEDIILEFDGKPINNVRGLTELVSMSEPGKSVILKVVRNGKEKVISVEIGTRPKEQSHN